MCNMDFFIYAAEEKESTEIPKNTNKTVSSAATVIESKKIKV